MEHRVYPIDRHTWRIEEYDAASSVYMYLLEGTRESVLIDTGFGMINIKEIVQMLTKLPVFVINTHGHFDHTGGNSLFSKVYQHEADVVVYHSHNSKKMQQLFPQYVFSKPLEKITAIHDGDVFDLGARTLEVIHSPGHSIGSICILDREQRWLFTGDTCCKADVLLNLDCCTTVEKYMKTIQKLKTLSCYFDVTWPAHHSAPVDPEILDRFFNLAKLLCQGEKIGETIETVFGPAKRLAVDDIGIIYLKVK